MEAQGTQSATLMTLMHQGGPIMWALLGFSILALAVALERSFVLYRRRGNLVPLLSSLRRVLSGSESVSVGVRQCEANRSSVAVVAKAALLNSHGSREEMERAIEAAARHELRRLRRRLGILTSTAHLAPLLGFLGTVTGMMASFGALAEFATKRPELVAMGIQEALTTTAAGLAVAVPVQLSYTMLASRVDEIQGDMETVAEELMRWAALGSLSHSSAVEN